MANKVAPWRVGLMFLPLLLAIIAAVSSYSANSQQIKTVTDDQKDHEKESTRRFDKMEGIQTEDHDAITEMQGDVRVLATDVNHIRGDMEDVKELLKEIRDQRTN